MSAAEEVRELLQVLIEPIHEYEVDLCIAIGARDRLAPGAQPSRDYVAGALAATAAIRSYLLTGNWEGSGFPRLDK